MSVLEGGAPDKSQAIAIVGMAGRAPKAKDLQALWRNLVDGVEGIAFFSDAEAIEDGVDPALLRQPNYVKARAYLEDVALFDAAFFGISPREAEALDPQQRLFLECAWQAVEDAGYDPLRCPGSVGVFGGSAQNTYFRNNLARNREFIAAVGPFQFGMLGYAGFLTTRVSYKLDLKGPSVQVDTACSTSLVAIVMACHSLLTYQCDMALAGGVMVGFPQRGGYLYQQGEITSPDGHCRPFDAKAAGTVGGEGVGVVVLKRLEDALAAGDPIRAVILGAAINNDGAHKVGFTAPSVEGQAEVIAAALALASVSPESISYVEAHGTATHLGDPIEVRALTRAWRAHTDRKQFCALGSLKSNIGHADFAAGVLGLIKAVLSLEQRFLPRSLHYERPNPEIDFAQSPFRVQATSAPWDGPRPLRAAVSSFGIGGTNAHLIVEEPPRPAPAAPAGAQLLLLSAKTRAALDQALRDLAAHLTGHPEQALADVAFTLQAGRTPWSQRCALVAGTAQDAVEALTAPDRKRLTLASAHPDDPGVVLMCSGQGAQYPGMGRGLYEREPVFRAALDECAAGLRPHLGLDLRQVLYPAAPGPEHAERLAQTWLTQPALFAIEWAMARQWLAWGVKASAVVGHSVGELVAACLAGVLALPDALALVAARGRLMQDLPRGEMLSVPLPEAEVQGLLDGELSLAAVNGPQACVVSGPSTAVQRLEQTLTGRGLPARRLHTSHAFHSAMMQPIVQPFTELVRRVHLAPATMPAVSTVTGTWIQPADWTDPAYWARNLREPVRFAAAAQSLLARRELALLEVGPGHTLCQLARQQGAAAAGRAIVASLRHPGDQGGDDREHVLAAAGRLWGHGIELDWTRLHGEARRRVRLPTYPFERQRYWVPARPEAAAPAAMAERRPDPAEWLYVPTWTRAMQVDAGALLLPRVAWLLLGAPGRLVAAVSSALERRGHPLLRVEPAEASARRGPAHWAVAPGDEATLRAVLRELAASGTERSVILHLDGVKEVPSDAAAAEQTLRLDYELLSSLARALGNEPERRTDLLLVTDRLHEVAGEAVHSPLRALAAGVALVLPQELPHVTCRQLDVELPGDAPALGALAEQILAEARAEGEAPVVALRGRHRWVRGFARVPRAPAAALPVRAGATYLITGGLGGLGLLFAEQLARAGRVRLVLTGRGALPPREQWSAWVGSHPVADATSVKIGKVRALEALGAEVSTLAGDVASAEAVRQLCAAVRQRFGPIHGVIHAAGVTAARSLDQAPTEASRAILAPKVAGTLHLADALAGEPLDFFLLCSSIATVLGGIAAADYCAANAFLDAFARQRRGPFRAIGFDAFSDVGMVAGADTDAVRQGIRAADVPGLLACALGCVAPELVVSTRDLDARQSRSRAAATAEAKVAEPGDGLSRHARPELAGDYVAPSNPVESAIAEVVQGLLGVDRVGVRDNFFDLGFDSLLAHRMIGQLQALVGVRLPLRIVLERSTVEELAAFLQGSPSAKSPT